MHMTETVSWAWLIKPFTSPLSLSLPVTHPLPVHEPAVLPWLLDDGIERVGDEVIDADAHLDHVDAQVNR